MKTKALVVDNNPVLLRAVSSILEKEGCEVERAVNGLEALDLLKTYTPDIVFTDLVMPFISGEQLCKIIRENPDLKDVFLVVVSGIVLEDIENLLADQYFDFCIAKGNLSELRGHIREALNRKLERKGSEARDPENVLPKIPVGLLPSTIATELLSEKRHLSRVLENLDEGIVELNMSGIVVSLNRAAQEILGLREESIIGCGFADYPWGESQEKVREWLTVQLPDPAGEQLEIQEDFPVLLNDRVITASFIPVRHEGGVFGLCILRDITRQYRAEEHERELNNAIKLVTKMEAMSYMAGGIAHDFNNLLTVICGNLDMLNHGAAPGMTADQVHLLQHARSAAFMAVDLTRKISNSSPFGIVSRQQYVLEDLVEETVHHFNTLHSAEVFNEYIGERSRVNVNPEQIATALTNILQNAVEAGDQVSIKVTTRAAELVTPYIHSGQYLPAGSYACIAVRDNGQGIARENLLKIFDPYFSTKARGTSKGMGLGLTVVYATMRNHGGYVVVESTPGAGTIVSCYLPRYGQAAGDTERDRIERGSRSRVLLIENDSQMQDVCRIMLEYLGNEVTIADGLQDALARLKEREATGVEQIQVVMIDPSQELSPDHARICSSMTEIAREVKIIVTGGSVRNPVMKDYRRFGYAGALPKPFTLDSLKHVLMVVTG